MRFAVFALTAFLALGLLVVAGELNGENATRYLFGIIGGYVSALVERRLTN